MRGIGKMHKERECKIDAGRRLYFAHEKDIVDLDSPQRLDMKPVRREPDLRRPAYG